MTEISRIPPFVNSDLSCTRYLPAIWSYRICAFAFSNRYLSSTQLAILDLPTWKTYDITAPETDVTSNERGHFVVY